MTDSFNIVIAMKPLEGNFAQNAVEHGVAGLNIDGCRVEGAKPNTIRGAGGAHGRYAPIAYQGLILDDGRGRFPANVMHDGSAEVVGLFPCDTKVATGTAKIRSGKKSGEGTWAGGGMQRAGAENTGVRDFGDTGPAARFFKQIGEYNG